jgi:multiple sugar transport system substrate-binding protein
MKLRVALVRGPMYDHLYDLFDPDQVDVVIHEDHPTLNQRVAELLSAGDQLDIIATHSKYAPSQATWLQPLESIVAAGDLEPLAPRAVELCRHRGQLLVVPRLIDVRVLWARSDRVEVVPDTWRELVASSVVFGFPGRESGLFGTFFELVTGLGGQLFDDNAAPCMDTDASVEAIELLCELAARAPSDLPSWHYDEVDQALLDGRIDAAGAWPGAWGAIARSSLSDVLIPHLYPAGPVRRVSYAGCHGWAIPTTSCHPGAEALLRRLIGFDAQLMDARGGTMCAHTSALLAVTPTNNVDKRRIEMTSSTIAESMITYPSLERFPEVEEAGWRAINAAIAGRLQPADAARAIQETAEQVL